MKTESALCGCQTTTCIRDAQSWSVIKMLLENSLGKVIKQQRYQNLFDDYALVLYILRQVNELINYHLQ